MSSKFITKEQFTEAISALETQFRQDRKNVDLIGQIFGTEEMTGSYNNSLLSKTIIRLLRNYFPVDENGHCEIEHYCYVMNFGKIGDGYESPEQLFDRFYESYYPDFLKEAKKLWKNEGFYLRKNDPWDYLNEKGPDLLKNVSFDNLSNKSGIPPIQFNSGQVCHVHKKEYDIYVDVEKLPKNINWKDIIVVLEKAVTVRRKPFLEDEVGQYQKTHEEAFILNDPINSTLTQLSGTIEKIRRATEKGPRENDLVAELARSAGFYVDTLKASIELTQKKPLRGGEEQDV